MLKFKVKLCLIVLLVVITCDYGRANFMEMDTATLVKAYLDAYFDTIADIAQKHAHLSNEQFNSELCFEQLKYLKNHLSKGDLWALKVIDSWGKLPSGVLQGNIITMGNLDQCVAIRQPSNDKSIGDFRGQFCMTQIGLAIEDNDPTYQNLSTSLGMSVILMKQLINVGIGLCVPATCSPQMLTDILEPNLVKLRLKTVRSFDNTTCHTDDPFPIKGVDYFAIVFFTLILFAMLSSTVVEIIYMKLKKNPPFGMVMFSMYTNGKQLLNFKKSKSEDAVHCIDGIKAISIIWVIYSHELFLGFFRVPTVNAATIIDQFTTNSVIIGSVGAMTVDSFLLVSGFLISWLGLKHIRKSKGYLNIPMMYFHRLIRIVPICFACALFQLSIYKFLGDGPLWKIVVDSSIDHCNNNFWSSLTFIGNYYRSGEPCPEINWYIAVDMQLYFISPFLILLVWKFGRKISFIFPVCIAIAIGSTFYVVEKYNLRNKTVMFSHDIYRYLMKIHYVTHIRMAAWIIGFVLGIIMNNLRGRKVKLSPVVVYIGWFTTTIIFSAIFFETKRLHSTTIEDNFEDALYYSFRNTIWSLGVAWIIFSSYYGYGGPINYILSMPIFRPISRLTLSIYLIHTYVYSIGFGINRAPIYINQYLIIQRTMGDVVISCFVAAFASLAFEIPFMQLERILCRDFRRENVEKSNIIETNTIENLSTKRECA